VLTGIGHETDRTIADEVAHTCTKTPTAAAAVLVEQVDRYLERLGFLAHQISVRSRSVGALAQRELASLTGRLLRAVPVALDRERRGLHERRRE